VLSEESSAEDLTDRMSWTKYWLIDPLDGTKEFIKKNGEFTVNIALIENGIATLGVVYAPALDVLYYGSCNGAFKIKGAIVTKISVKSLPENDETWDIVGSRSHQSTEFLNFVRNFKNHNIVTMGSSLKICLVAEGKADLYPRLGLTSEWDTAAAHAVLTAAGGLLLSHQELSPLIYNTKAKTLLNPFFIACSEISKIWSK
jgi:3'(2'), 5'-bisphosphate nucleotidase